MSVYYITIISVFYTSLLTQVVNKKKLDSFLVNKQKMQNNSIFVFITAAILICVAGFRSGVGTDYWQYASGYDKYISNIWNAIFDFKEPGINIIAKISSLIYDDYSMMFFIASTITVGLSVWTISKYSNTFAFSILLYIFTGAWNGSFNGVRQYLACAVIFAGHRYIIDRKFIKYVFVVLMASAFHITAIVMIMLYFIPLKTIDFKKITLLTIAVILALYSYDIVFGIVETIKGKPIIMHSYMVTKVNYFRIAVACAPLPLYFFFTLKKNLSVEDIFYINVLFVNATLMLVTSNSAYLARIGIYTDIFCVLSYQRLLNFQNKKLVQIMKIFMIGLYVIFWYIGVSGDDSMSSFQWIFHRQPIFMNK